MIDLAMPYRHFDAQKSSGLISERNTRIQMINGRPGTKKGTEATTGSFEGFYRNKG
jgi:hypothetical protein